jgi:hypothetical protein
MRCATSSAGLSVERELTNRLERDPIEAKDSSELPLVVELVRLSATCNLEENLK